MKEWVIGYRDKDGTLRINGFSKWYDNEADAQDHMDYLETEWRTELEKAAEKEDLKKTNWSTLTLAKKRKEKHILLVREVSPYTIIREARDWE